MTSIAARPISVDPASVHRQTLSNGLTVLVRRDATVPVVAIVTHVKAGYFDETDDVVGIAHVLEHMYFKGTPTRGVGEIARETKANGGYLNAGTIYDQTVYYTVLPASGLHAGLEIQADAYTSSLVDADELGRELEVIIQEAKRKADNPGAVASETLYAALHERHRMRRWRIGREPGLRALTRDDVVRFYRNFYRPSTTILSIVGDVDVDATFAAVRRLYGALDAGVPSRSPGPAEGDAARFRYQEMAGDIQQAQVAFGWRTPATLHEDTPALDIAAIVVGAGRASRLYRAVRERQLAASTSAYNYTPSELGVFVAYAEAPAETALDAARGIWHQMRAVREGDVAVTEVDRARRIFESRWLRQLESMEGQARHLAEWEALGDWRLGDRYFERAMTASAADIGRVAAAYLPAERAALVIYRPVAAPAVAADASAVRALLDAPVPAPLPPPDGRGEPEAPAVLQVLPLEREEGGIRVYRTAGGVPVLVRRRAGSAIVHVGAFIRRGAAEEPDRLSGLSTLLARTALKGTERRSAARIAEDSELLGAQVAGSVTSDGLGWSVSVPATHVDAAVDLLADVVQWPTFPDDALETERTVVLANLAQLRDDMYRFPVRLATQEAYAGHPYARSALGSEASVPGVRPDDLRTWHRTRVRSAPWAIAMVGDVDPDEAAALIARAFSDLTAADATPLDRPRWPGAMRAAVERRSKAQTAMALAFEGPARDDPARYTSALLAGIASSMGGRFFEELRDRQSLAYTVQAYASERQLAGTFIAYIATSPEKEERARRGLLDEFAKLRDGGVTDAELARAQAYAIGSHAIRQQSGGAVLSDMVDAWLYGAGLAELEAHETRIRAVTAAQVRELARRYFDEERRVEGIVRGEEREV